MNRMLDALVRAARQQVKGIAGNLLAVIGAAVTIGAFLSLLTARPMRVWVSRHPFLLFATLIIAIFVLLVVLNYAQDLRGRYDALASSARPTERPQPTSHDSALFRKLLATLPPDGRIMEWLKEDFNILQLPSERLRSLSEAGRKLILNPVGFDDRNADGSYRGLKTSIESFCQKAREWAVADARDTYLEIPPEWEFEHRERYRTAIADIQEARDRLINAYDGFLHACHSAGMDS